MIIYSPADAAIIEAPITREAIIKFVLMGDYYIELPFAWDTLINFPRGSYIVYKNRKFEIMSNVRPEFDNNTGGYKYTLQFQAQQNHMKRFVCFWLGGQNPEAVFHNTTDLTSFGALIVANMNKSLGTESWQLGTVAVENPEAAKLVSFNGDKCWDALNTIAETFEVEWWTEENGGVVTLNFGKLELGTPEIFKRGDVVESIPAKKGDDSSYGTRFYVFGSTRNLTSDYGQAEQGGTTNHVSEIRLRLPNGQEYIDAIPDLPGRDIVEQVVFFDDIYPKNTETVSSVETIDREIIEGQTDKAYVMVCPDTPFVPSDVIEGETIGAHFTSGDLMGWDFELALIDDDGNNIDPATWKPEDGFNKKFEIIAQVETSGESQQIIPNENLRPRGKDDDRGPDTFVLTGVKLPQQRIEEAEEELLAAGISYAAKHSNDTDVYDCDTNPVYCQNNDKNYEAGQAVLLVGPQFGENGRLSRIQGYQKKLYNEYIATYTVGDNTPYSRIGSIESDVKATLYSQRIGVTGSGASIYLITRYDGTSPTDANAYSARRAMWEFANKQTADTFKGRMTFNAGAQFGDFAGGMTGIGGLIDNKGNAELDSLKLRRFLEVPELNYNRVEISVGDDWSAPGGGVIESVDTYQRLVSLRLEDGEIGAVKAGDICMGIFHSIKTSENATADADDSRGNRTFAGFATAYFRITEVIGDHNEQFKYELRPRSATFTEQINPMAAMTFVAYGSFTDASRRTSRYSTRSYQRYLRGVSDWEFTADNIAAQFGDLSNLSVFGLSMSGYSAYLNNIYMSGVIQQFTPEGEEVPTIIDRGIWSPTSIYNKNDDVYWNNARWRCTQDGTTSEPSESAVGWVLLEQAIVGPDGSSAIPVYRLSPDEPATPTGTSLPPEGWTLDVPAASDTEAVWMSIASVKDNAVFAWTRPSRISGKDGAPGLQGCIVRITEWSAGVEYRNDVQLNTSDLRYIDIVTVNNNGNQLKYQCTATHTSSEVNKPGLAGSVAFWQQLNDMVPIYTPLLLADNAVINFLQGMQLLVHDKAGNIVAGMVGKSIPLFVGSSDPATSPFRVNEDGALTATKATVAGEINAESGVIGPFKIGVDSDQDSLIAEGTGKIVLGSSIAYLNRGAISSDIHRHFDVSMLYGPVATLRSINDTAGTDNTYNMGLNISVAGKYLKGPAVNNVPSGNHAIYVGSGDFCGFRPYSRYFDPGAHQLERYDTVVLAGSENGNIAFYLPSDPEPNHLIIIRKLSDKNTVYVNGNGKQIVWNDSNAWVNNKSFTGRRAVSILYSGDLGVWVQWISSN